MSLMFTSNHVIRSTTKGVGMRVNDSVSFLLLIGLSLVSGGLEVAGVAIDMWSMYVYRVTLRSPKTNPTNHSSIFSRFEITPVAGLLRSSPIVQ
ncbi:hypothetical protein BO70DRAFT_6826 [Aspergillus heteromorphus CBS 117.55]|uniref:Uncharacterized protein n=1 Tax=Aspergillus heteromorphus CBS 117.55 TaxID=1448321 RepID=A0A317X2A0_9EURO|nr:uncharacterized protein BO70DRAFT_6826 [Aspergillus heteromorphus CBS 117.55]PWY92271.1 hypothetical protein BO70DRAFT_6826 [Aspergillus heteromorphus CBS 117.55]